MKKIYLLAATGVLLFAPRAYTQPERTGPLLARLSSPHTLSAPSVVRADILVSGRVTDEQGAGLPGVSVVVKGSTQGTTTDGTGSYRISVPNEQSVLVFSFVGYLGKEVAVGSQTVLNVTMAPGDQTLNEVVVVGYGTQRRQDITSAVSTISVDRIGEVPASNVTRLFQGQAPGVVTRQRSGTPGQQFDVRIRGISSLGAGSDPLYVIDGFPVGLSVGQNLNPNDIESVSILKDAAATAIYGARGSNGVVLITTKNAREGKVGLNLSVDYGVNTLPDSRKVRVLNGPEFAQFKKEVLEDNIRYFQKREPTLNDIPIGFRFPEQTKYSTNWYDLILNDNAPFTDVNLTLSSGRGPIRSVVSAGYYKEDGILQYTDYDRTSLRVNLAGDVNKFITMGVNLAGSYARSSLANTDGRSNIVGGSLIMDPRFPAYDEKGELIPYYNGTDGVFGFPNPLFVLKNLKRNRNIADLLASGYAEITLLKGLKFRSSLNARINYNTYKEYVPSTIGLPVQNGTNGAPPRIATQRDDSEELRNYAADQLLTYATTFNENHRFDVLAGFSAQQETVKGLYGSGNTYPDDLVPFLSAASIRSSNSMERTWTMLAYIARANYSFKDKYLLSASWRREGSSRFSADNKYGNFPAVSAGWRVSEETFFPKTAWVNDLKLRGSWGKTGNNSYAMAPAAGFGIGQNAGSDGNYASQAFLGINNYILGNQLVPGKVVTSFANTELGWEMSDQLDLGMDLSMFSNRLTFTFEYYNKITTDMLLNVPIPSVSGFTNSLANVGKVRNRGIELAGDFRTKIGPVNFRSNANISFNRSKILAIKGANDFILQGSFYGGYNIQQVGQPIGMIFGYEKLGIFNTQAEIDAAPKQDGVIPGGMRFRDIDGNGEVTYDTRDMTIIGNPNPAFTWGWTVAADWKRFDINILLMGAHDFDIYRNIEASTMNMDGVFNVLDKAKDRWRSPENPGSNPGAKNSQGGTNYFKWSRESSERYVYDASHTWIRNVTIGYNIPKVRSILSNARVFVNVSNLFLFTKYPGGNPDASVRGGTELNNDDESYPVPRTFSTGIKLNF